MQPKIEDLIAIARGAGEILRAGFGKQHQIEFKGEIDLVTEVDHQSERYILGEISSRFPGHRVLTEETGEHTGEASRAWYIDPLDGTLNYSHGLPFFCVSIAYAHEGELGLAAVFDPIAEEMFAAKHGSGASLNGEIIRVSRASTLKSSLLVTGFPYDAWTNPVNNFAEFSSFSMRSQGVRRLGSAALDLCYVAAGRLDGFWEIRLNAWDVAAGALIAKEAGALVTDVRGGPDFMSKPQSVLAANPLLHAKMLEVLGQSDPARA
ncbi:MAG: inositol monophosphatase family protein [Anaerolineales bacterium]